jgi:hypothetical protein
MDAVEPKFKKWPDDSELVEIINAIDKAEQLLISGYLRVDELTSLSQRAGKAYEAAADHDSIQYRKYDKARRSTSRFTPVRNNGYAEPSDGAHLQELKQQIVELLHLHEVEIEPKEVFIAPGEPFTGRLAIRNILSRAESSIDIKDDYLFSANKRTKNIELLAVLGPYLAPPLSIKARLLGASQNPPNEVVSDVAAFMRQYPSAKFMGYSHSASGTKESHGRFVIIDMKEVFAIDASVKDLGTTQALISQVKDPAVISSYLKQFDEWWSKAAAYTNL